MLAIRHDLRPGDIGRLVWLHGTLYAAEYGWDHTFEAYVAVPLGEFALRRNPRERIWLVDDDAGVNGSIAIVEAALSVAQLRWFLVAPSLRGRGLGKRLLDESIAFSRDAGYESIFLWTVSSLTAAARLYTAAGFRIVEETEHELWGTTVVEQKYELRL